MALPAVPVYTTAPGRSRSGAFGVGTDVDVPVTTAGLETLTYIPKDPTVTPC